MIKVRKPSPEAENALRAICTHLCMTTVQDENLALWLQELQAIAEDCGHCPKPMSAMLTSAEALCRARAMDAQAAALARLRVEVHRYYLGAAGHWVEAWRARQAGGEVVE
ncbi:hypothetical protein [Mameliella sediminis]|uniref:hypothetical protein n=1 Tax=Mameliella sediminis TaxID=2836866 RepID=UPI001C457DC4|nr:hypothetical protein [Mameliella sediminis]MBV7394573.1 hypothetical protein [Mameliella sediminis]